VSEVGEGGKWYFVRAMRKFRIDAVDGGGLKRVAGPYAGVPPADGYSEQLVVRGEGGPKVSQHFVLELPGRAGCSRVVARINPQIRGRAGPTPHAPDSRAW
jgi:hypothetical protein